MFSINEPTHLVLKPLEKFTSNIKCEKSRSTSISKYLLHIGHILYIYAFSIGDKKVLLNRFFAETATILEGQANCMCTIQR